MKRTILWLLLAAGSSACAPRATTRGALYGDLATLKREIAAAQAGKTLDQATTRELALAVARRELASAKGDVAIQRIEQVRSCVEPVRGELTEHAKVHDDAGAVAALALIGAGYGDAEEYFEDYQGDERGAWRAVAARSATLPENGSARRKMMTDGDERVRLGAFQAALNVRDIDDAPELLDAMRLDPSPLNRSAAARAAGSLGGERVVLALRDRYDSAAEAEQMVVIDAWGQPAAFASGGERELVSVAETQTGLRALAASGRLQAGGEAARRVALAVMLRAIATGTREERRLAIRSVTLSDPAVADAIHGAADDADPEVSVMALARLVAIPARRVDAVARLRKRAADKSNIGLQATSALAAASDSSVHPDLVKALTAPSAHRRRIGALGLLRLGDFSAAATALGDDSPTVRTEVACEMLNTL